MQPPDIQKRRPPGGEAASRRSFGGDPDSVALECAGSPEFEGAYAVLVTSSQRNSRRLYLSLHSASAAVDRARQRGAVATLVLCRLVPVGSVVADR